MKFGMSCLTCHNVIIDEVHFITQIARELRSHSYIIVSKQFGIDSNDSDCSLST